MLLNVGEQYISKTLYDNRMGDSHGLLCLKAWNTLLIFDHVNLWIIFILSIATSFFY